MLRPLVAGIWGALQLQGALMEILVVDLRLLSLSKCSSSILVLQSLGISAADFSEYPHPQYRPVVYFSPVHTILFCMAIAAESLRASQYLSRNFSELYSLSLPSKTVSLALQAYSYNPSLPKTQYFTNSMIAISSSRKTMTSTGFSLS